MSDIKKTALIILIIALLSNTFTQYAYAANNYNHSELLEYEGYGQAMYESIIEQTTYMTGHYTDNRDYVSQSIDEILDYANFWKDEFNDWDSVCSGFSNSSINDCIRGAVEGGGGLVLTGLDWLGDLWDSFFASEGDPGEVVFADGIMGLAGLQAFAYAPYGLRIDYTAGGGSVRTYNSGVTVPITFTYNVSGGYATLYNEHKVYGDVEKLLTYFSDYQNAPNFASFASLYSWFGYGVALITKDGDVNYTPNPSRPPISRDHITNVINSKMPVPQPKPKLVCPDGTQIQMSVSGSTFLSVDGSVMLVNKDGTAMVNGSLCNLFWEKPTYSYDPDGKPIVTDPDGNTEDLTVIPKDNFPSADDLEGCDGVLCGIGKLLDGLGSLVSSITGMVKSLLDGLLKLFVPEDLDFMTQEFNKITKKLNDKIAITETLKEAITSVFDGGGSNPLANISLNLPITNEPLTFGNVAFIEEGVPILRKVISAIVVLYTIAYVYRKITGRGGVMER